jgi:hypothetical protein
MIILRRVSIVALAAVLLVAPAAAPSAHAAATRCAGTLTDPGTLTGPVPGNVIVPEGQACLLSGADIQGNLFVRAGALLGDDNEDPFGAPNVVRGNLRAEGGEFVGLENTRVFGNADLKASNIDLIGVNLVPGGFRQFRVDGNLIIEEATRVVVAFASVGRNLRAINLRAPTFGVLIRGVNQVGEPGQVGEFGRIGGNVVVKDSVASQIEVNQNILDGRVDVRGNVTTEGGVAVSYNDALGNISIVDNEPRDVSVSFGGLDVQGNQTGGNLDVIDNVVQTLPGSGSSITSNEVDGNMAVIRTRGTGAKTVTRNTVAGTLRCFENDPPFVGAPNIAAKLQGQCS